MRNRETKDPESYKTGGQNSNWSKEGLKSPNVTRFGAKKQIKETWITNGQELWA